MLKNKKNTLLENDLKESKKYTKTIMNKIANLLDDAGYAYVENESKTEIIVYNYQYENNVRKIIGLLDVDKKLIDILITTDIIHDKVFIRLVTI